MTVTREKKASQVKQAASEDQPPTRTSRWRWLLPAFGLIAWLVIGGGLGQFAGKTSEVQKNDNASFLPASTESTAVLELNKKFVTEETSPGLIVYARESGLTPTDLAKIQADMGAIADRVGADLAGAPIGPQLSEDGKAAQVLVLFKGSDLEHNAEYVDWIREQITTEAGLTAHVTGPAGIFTDFMAVFGLLDGVLLAVALGVVLLILIVVYRSPLLPFVVVFNAVMALGAAMGVVYLLAKNDVITLSGQSQGILMVLAVGAATDYALLLVARFREELRRHGSRFDAMRVAWRASLEPILASGGTVILGLLCLLVSDLRSNQGLGPIGAIGIAFSIIASLTLLPALLLLLGRVAFWPYRPKLGSAPAESRGIWAKVAGLVGRRPRMIWAVSMLVLIVAALGMFRLEASGIPQTEGFTKQTDSKSGQELIAAHFAAGSGSPAEVIANEAYLTQIMAAAKAVPGVASVIPYAERPLAPPSGQPQPGEPQPGPGELPAPEPKVVDGLVRVDVTLTDAADSPDAAQTLVNLREAVHAVEGADAKVGGFTAINYDVQQTSQHDRKIIIPLVLAVVFLVLMLLLRSILAPLLLISTVVLSYLATLGVSGFVFRDVLGFAGADSAFPLFAFVFLVALGVDYNIFLMTRVREEAGKLGHREGTLHGLAVTGGVITSAGIVLAATFAALSVLPLVFLAQMAFAVAFGVLLDTFLVRSLLVPALTLDIGRRIWWPGSLRRTAP